VTFSTAWRAWPTGTLAQHAVGRATADCDRDVYCGELALKSVIKTPIMTTTPTAIGTACASGGSRISWIRETVRHTSRSSFGSASRAGRPVPSTFLSIAALTTGFFNSRQAGYVDRSGVFGWFAPPQKRSLE
jgi:hypothetical protein